jgi:hypothetical protein
MDKKQAKTKRTYKNKFNNRTKNILIIVLRNSLNNILSNTRKEITKI